MRSKIIAAPATLAVAALALAGCSDADGETIADPPEEAVTTESEPEETEDTEPEVEETESEDPEEAKAEAPAGDQSEVEIGETIDDPDLGDSIEIVSAIRDFPSEEEAELIADGGEVVLLQISVTPSDEWGGRVSAGDFEISWDDGADFWNNKTRMVEDEMTDAGFEPTDGFSRRDGEATAWIAFLPEERQDSYLVRYGRGPAEVIGSDEEIDSFSTEFEIPAP